MSIAAKLFVSGDAKAETLHRRITPSDVQFEDQKKRWNDLAEYLIAKLGENTGYSMATWLQGSYKFDTQIRPSHTDAEFDIDLGLYFVWAGQTGDTDYEPEQLKALVQSALVAYQVLPDNDATEVTNPKERCCRIRFAPDFHIDVPCYHLDRGRDARTLATETKGWEESDPKAIYEWFKKLHEDGKTRAQLRRLIRYLKMWAALKIEAEHRPSSILLTVLAAEAFGEFAVGDSFDDDELLEHVSAKIADRLIGDESVLNPINLAEDLNRLDAAGTSAFIEHLENLADVGKRARDSGNIIVAAEIWSEAFDQFFPMPEDTAEGITEVSKGRGIVIYSYAPDVAVRAVHRQNKNIVVEGVNQIKALPKDCDISFRILNPEHLPNGATIKWTVRNHGDEAALENDLGHVAGNTLSVHRHSAYNGDHSMDVTVFLGHQFLGRRRIMINVQGPPPPPRQLKMRRQFRR